jgi:hypothetical protein
VKSAGLAGGYARFQPDLRMAIEVECLGKLHAEPGIFTCICIRYLKTDTGRFSLSLYPVVQIIRHPERPPSWVECSIWKARGWHNIEHATTKSTALPNSGVLTFTSQPFGLIIWRRRRHTSYNEVFTAKSAH